MIEIGTDHVTIKGSDETITIVTDMIGTWCVVQSQSDVKAPPPSPASTDPALTRKLLEIEARFNAQTQSATITFHAPDFILPVSEIKGQQSANAITIWNRVKDKYHYAAKINELSAKFGRIQPLIVELKSLADQFPSSLTVRRHLGYLHWLSGNRQEALELFRDLALHSKNSWDWYNLAVLAVKYEQEELACFSLERFFHSVALTEKPTAWYLYVRLLRRCLNYQALKVLEENKSRVYSDKECEILFETSVYLLMSVGYEKVATELVKKQQEGYQLLDLTKEALSQLDEQPTINYQRLVAEMAERISKKPSVETTRNEPQGYIHTYKSDKNYGFLRGADGKTYFFHRSAVSDDDLFNQIKDLAPGKQIPVTFEIAQGPKGPLAIGVALYRTIDQMFTRATEYADEGDYSKAIAQIKKVLDLNPDYPSAREYYEKWREYARISGVPRGSNPYARAKRVQLIEKDLERAAKLLQDAINQGDNAESAVKDLAALLVQLGRAEAAILVLEQNRKKIRDQQSVDNMLIGFYQNVGQHDHAIALLERKFSQATTEGKQASILWQIANSYLRKEDYVQAELKFRQVLQLQPDNRAAQRNIAICLFKQARYDEAQKILNSILSATPDAQAADLLEAIEQARATGESARVDSIAREALLTELIVERSRFTEFFLSRCDYRGLSPDRIKKGDDGKQFYIGSRRDARHDIDRLEDIARQLGTRRPSERADYYLTAARISETDDPNQFYQYLCRSFSSKGDSFVTENKPLDSARELYSESLAVYDGYLNPGKGEDRYDEQDAVNALVRYMYSWLGRESIPTVPPKRKEQESVLKQQLQYIDDAIEEIITKHPQREKVFDAISYLIFRSKYAGERILRSLYLRSSLQALSLDYLQRKGVVSPRTLQKIDDFITLWNEYQRKRLENARYVSNEIRFLTNLEIYPASLENNIERLKTLIERIFLDLDRQRLAQIQSILE
ncbi:MAG: tetratricopeptide repeat protein, partial [Nitrososphaera sp.]